jgi:xylan 1,4-beta-xylosidase
MEERMRTIVNPILKGFNPDPSILRVGDDYYIATSTFEWFPGVQIHHSKDLVNWELVAHPLNRLSLLNMAGNPTSGGIWAPCLSYHEGLFYLIYTDVKSWCDGPFKDTHNYLTTARSVTGEWSESVYLNSSGFDASLFHDDDGKKYLVNMQWEYRKDRNRFSGILLQEYDPKAKRLVGPITNIFRGTELGLVEGPHLYKKDGYYYLMTAEGGTRFAHAVTLARSKAIAGPYEVHPANPILTSWNDPTLEIQRAGHGSLVETQNGEWYLTHLCGRPIPSRGRCMLGRETAIQKMEWKPDGWLYVAGGGNKPKAKVEAPNLPEHRFPPKSKRDDFDSPALGIDFQTLRVPLGEDTLSLTERKGFLRLKGRESPSSKFHQSLVARRQQAFKYTASTALEFEPETYAQMAGLICLYDTKNYFYLYLSRDEQSGKVLNILKCDDGAVTEPLAAPIPFAGERCYLKADVDYHLLRFSFSSDGKNWTKIGREFDASILSDEYTEPHKFTGAFVGVCCQDLTGRRKHADFDFFEYDERD